MVEDIDNCNHHPMNISHGNTIFIGWKKPQEGWLTGYSRKIGNCDALSAEMWGGALGYAGRVEKWFSPPSGGK
ncbi:hypothetical protein L195_g061506 [Trifolium pratense]|uniref:Uncharacterized protein n=1 Tax=Trifolium pratense TaxID=57577 RepID=A0A2K3KA90_TRIPR|nr:hypothetical protein L195_g061506 [Trifolium pratense]